MSFANGYPLVFNTTTNGVSAPISQGSTRGLTITAYGDDFGGASAAILYCNTGSLDPDDYVALAGCDGDQVVFTQAGGVSIPSLPAGTNLIVSITGVTDDTTPISVFVS